MSTGSPLRVTPLHPDVTDASHHERTWPKQVFEMYSREPLLAQLCVVVSTYTRKIVIDKEVTPHIIRVIPYGIDLDFFCPAQRAKNKFRVLFAGNIGC